MSFTITNDSNRDITLGAAVFPPANFGYSPPLSTCDNLVVLAAHTSCYWGLAFIAPITPGTYTGVFKQPTSQRDPKVTLTGTSTGP